MSDRPPSGITFLPFQEEKLRARYIRVLIERNPPGTPGATTVGPLPQTTPYNMPEALQITPDFPVLRFTKSGRCIYCGATEYAPGHRRPLGEEHIIAEGMGGSLILPEASCLRCEGITSSIEGSVLRNLFGASRQRLRVRRTNKIEDIEFPVTSVVDGRDVILKLPLDQHPTVLFMANLALPGIFENRIVGHSGIHGIWMHFLNDPSNYGLSHYATPTLDSVRFGQFLAKIAHSFAYASIGGDLNYYLTDFIRRKFARTEPYPEMYHLIGGEPLTRPPATALHEIGGAFAEFNGKWIFTTHIPTILQSRRAHLHCGSGRSHDGIKDRRSSFSLKSSISISRMTSDKTRA